MTVDWLGVVPKEPHPKEKGSKGVKSSFDSCEFNLLSHAYRVCWKGQPDGYRFESNVDLTPFVAANMLATNMATLAAQHQNLNATELLQATAASYNFGTGNISGNVCTIDVGTAGNNYGSNVLDLMDCFQ